MPTHQNQLLPSSSSAPPQLLPSSKIDCPPARPGQPTHHIKEDLGCASVYIWSTDLRWLARQELSAHVHPLYMYTHFLTRQPPQTVVYMYNKVAHIQSLQNPGPPCITC